MRTKSHDKLNEKKNENEMFLKNGKQFPMLYGISHSIKLFDFAIGKMVNIITKIK